MKLNDPRNKNNNNKNKNPKQALGATIYPISISIWEENKLFQHVETYHLQEGKVAKSNVVKVDLDFCPEELSVIHGETVRLVVDHRDAVDEARFIHTLPKLASKQVDSHDAED